MLTVLRLRTHVEGGMNLAGVERGLPVPVPVRFMKCQARRVVDVMLRRTRRGVELDTPHPATYHTRLVMSPLPPHYDSQT